MQSIKPTGNSAPASTFAGLAHRSNWKKARVLVRAEEEFQIEQMEDILRDKLIRRKVDTGCLEARRDRRHREARSGAATESFRESIATRAGKL